MNLFRLMSILFILSELILCRVISENFAVAKLALCRSSVKFLASVILWDNLYNSIFF